MRGKVSLAVATLFMAGLTLTPMQSAWSEPKPTAAPTVQNEVNVGQPGGSPAASPAASPGAPGSKPTGDSGGPPAKRMLKRNPFVPPSVTTASTPTTPTPAGNPGGKPSDGGKPSGKPSGKPAPPVEDTPPPPGFSLAGIFSSGGFPTALLITPTGPVQARVGQTVQGYKVTSINLTSRQVVVEIKNHAFRVSLPKEGPYGAGSKGGSDSGGAAAPKGDSGAPPADGGGKNAPLPPPPPAKGGK